MDHDRNDQEEPAIDLSLDVESNFDEMLSALRVGVDKPSADRDNYNEDPTKYSSHSPQTDLDAYIAPNSEGYEPYLQTPPGGLEAEHGQVATTNGYENGAIERENSSLEDRESLDSSAEDFEDEVVHHDIVEENYNDDQPRAASADETEVPIQAEKIQHTLEDNETSESKYAADIHDVEISAETAHDTHVVDDGWVKCDYSSTNESVKTPDLEPTVLRHSGATVEEDDYEEPKAQLAEELASLAISAGAEESEKAANGFSPETKDTVAEDDYPAEGSAKEDEKVGHATNGFLPEAYDTAAEIDADDKEEENAYPTTDDLSPETPDVAAESDTPNEEMSVDCCAKCGDCIRLSDELRAKGKAFHKDCFRCIKCSCQLTTDNCEMVDGQLYCEPHYSEMFNYGEEQKDEDSDTVLHSSDGVLDEGELPEPEYTKNMIAKFQQPPPSSPPQTAMQTPKVGKVKTPDFLNNNEKPSPEPSPPVNDILPPTGSAKRLVEQWSTIGSQEKVTPKPQPADEHYYAPNTAKMIAAKFSAGLFNEDAGDRSSPKATRNGHTGECMANGDQNDPELPAEGMARGLIAKFSVLDA